MRAFDLLTLLLVPLARSCPCEPDYDFIGGGRRQDVGGCRASAPDWDWP